MALTYEHLDSLNREFKRHSFHFICSFFPLSENRASLNREFENHGLDLTYKFF